MDTKPNTADSDDGSPLTHQPTPFVPFNHANSLTTCNPNINKGIPSTENPLQDNSMPPTTRPHSLQHADISTKIPLAHTTHADTSTHATLAAANTQPSSANPKPHTDQTFESFVPLPHNPSTPIHIPRLTKALEHHPDRKAVNFVINGLTNGFSIGCKTSVTQSSPKNLKSATSNPKLVTAAFNKELSKGHISGPFSQPPLKDLHCSPVGMRQKPDGSARIILDLSQPEGNSVNSGIDKSEYSVQYTSFDEATDIIAKTGKNALLTKIDIASAFRIIPVKKEEWHLLGMRWLDKYFIDTHLPFGSRSSPFIFTVFADLLTWIIQNQIDPNIVVHYLDDFLIICRNNVPLASSTLHKIIRLFNWLNIPIAHEKLEGPAISLVFLGIRIDTSTLKIALPQDKLDTFTAELAKWRARKKCTKLELLSLIGKMSFAAKVVRPGRTFLRRLIDLSTKAKKLHHHIFLNSQARKDIEWWIQFLPKWNGTSIMYNCTTTQNSDISLYTDASNIGFGVYYEPEWMAISWPDYITQKPFHFDINFRELFAIYTAVCTFSHRWRGKRLIMHTDNSTIIHAWHKGTSHSKYIMTLVREIIMCAALKQFTISFQFLPGARNEVADALSRMQLDRFRALAPHSSYTSTAPASEVWSWQASLL